MARKGWDSLTSDYRKRLESNGISKKDYESGKSIAKARGHGHTPERPHKFDRKNPQYAPYVQQQNSLLKRVEIRKFELWSTYPKWNPIRSSQNLRRYPPSLELMRWALSASEEELISAIRENPEDFSWLGYK